MFSTLHGVRSPLLPLGSQEDAAPRATFLTSLARFLAEFSSPHSSAFSDCLAQRCLCSTLLLFRCVCDLSLVLCLARFAASMTIKKPEPSRSSGSCLNRRACWPWVQSVLNSAPLSRLTNCEVVRLARCAASFTIETSRTGCQGDRPSSFLRGLEPVFAQALAA